MLLALLPCAPGAMFLVAGALCEPPRAHALYRAGAVALGAGVLCGGVIGWKIARRREDDPGETP